MSSLQVRARATHLAIALAIFVAEVLIATVFSRVVFVRAFVGDFLVVMLVYHVVKGFTLVRPRPLAVGVFLFACLVEGVQYFHPVDRLGLRHGSVLAIVMGNSFSWEDVLMYFLGCLASWLLDSRLLSRPDVST